VDLTEYGMTMRLPDGDLSTLSERIASRLDAMRAAMRRHFVVEGLAILAAAIVLAAGLSLLLDWQLELSRGSRWACSAVFAAVFAWIAYRRLVQPLVMEITPLDVAAAIDRSSGGVAQDRLATRVASVLELPKQAQANEYVSQELVTRAVAASYEDLERVDFHKHLNSRHWWLSLAAIIAAISIPTAVAIGAPALASLWKDRWLLGSNRQWPHATILEVANLKDGRLIVPRGESAGLQVNVTDSGKETEDVWMRLTSPAGQAQTVSLNRVAAGDFRWDLPPLQEPMDGEVWGGDGRSEPFRIEPMDRPKITSLKLTAKHPREAVAQSFVFAGEEGNVRLLPKTEAALQFEVNVPIDEVRVETETGPQTPFAKLNDKSYEAKWTHNGQVKMRVTLVATGSGLESFPRPITIGEKPDRPPTVSIKHSGVRLRVTPMATIPLTLTARDDYGLHEVDLDATVNAKPGADSPHDEPAEATEKPAETNKKPGDQAPTEKPADSAPETPPVAPATEKPADAPTSPAPATEPSTPAKPEGAASNSKTGSLQFVAFADEAAPKAEEPKVFEDSEEKPAPPVVLPTEQHIVVYGPQEPALETVVEHSHSLELSQLNVQPGQSLTVTGSATDDSYSGRQAAASRRIIFKVVKDDELFKEILLRQQQLRARLRKAYEQMIDLRDKIKAADVQAEGGDLLRSYLLTRREIGAVARELDAAVLEMRLNKLGGAESWDLIENTVVKPLAALQEGDLERQKQALETFTGNQPDPVDAVLERQQSIIDAIKKVLDNMSQWDSFIDIVNQVNSIIKIEDVVRKMTEALKEKQTESIFDK
jgi:hypothetical protein